MRCALAIARSGCGVMQRLAQDGEIDRPFFNRRIFDVAQPVFEICEAVLAVSFLSLGLRPSWWWPWRFRGLTTVGNAGAGIRCAKARVR